MKKPVCFMLCVSLLLAILPMNAFGFNVFSGGDGSINNPYQIETADQLFEVRYYLDKHFIQIADIDLSSATSLGGDYYDGGSGWLPIGSYDSPFTGSYNGNNRTISGMIINRGTESSVYIGLFAYISGTVKNLFLNDCNITGGKSNITSYVTVGGIAAFLNNGSKIVNCHVSGNITGRGDSYIWLGSIIGRATDGCEISNSSSEATITVQSQGQIEVGGIAGNTTANGKKLNMMVDNCVNKGAINITSTATDSKKTMTGGIVGCDDNGCFLSLTKCKNEGIISVTGLYSINTAGILGYCYSDNLILKRNQNAGNITVSYGSGTSSNPSFYTGGIVGQIGSGSVNPLIAECSNVADLKCETSISSIYNHIGGIIPLAHEGKMYNCFNTGNIEAKHSSYLNIGGIVGENDGFEISTCYNTGGLTGYSTKSCNVGAIAGWNSGDILNCFWSINSAQIYNNLPRDTASKLGVGKTSTSFPGTHDATSVSPAVLKSASFVASLNEYNTEFASWTVDTTATNNGYPVFITENEGGSGDEPVNNDYSIIGLSITDSAGVPIDDYSSLRSFVVETELIKNSDRDKKDYLIIAIYDSKGTFISFSYMKMNFDKGKTAGFGALITLPENVYAAKIKSFVWAGIGNMIPLSNAMEL